MCLRGMVSVHTTAVEVCVCVCVCVHGRWGCCGGACGACSTVPMQARGNRGACAQAGARGAARQRAQAAVLGNSSSQELEQRKPASKQVHSVRDPHSHSRSCWQCKLGTVITPTSWPSPVGKVFQLYP